ncbi:MAG: hypothetical protein JJ855_14135 [Rhodospirillales bacterium]|nr:hypothetical protein [Rhodospirillales bacterium]
MTWEAKKMTDTYPFPAKGGIEPKLSELLDDPVLQTLLDYDGLSVDDLRACVADWRNRRLHADGRFPYAA